MIYCKIDIYSHHFKVSMMRPLMHRVLRPMFGRLTEYQGVYVKGRFKKKAQAVYAAACVDRSEYRIHINQLEEFYGLIRENSINMERLQIETHPLYEPVAANLKVIESMQPRNDQPRLIKYMTGEGRTKLVTLETGGGKTFCAAKTAEARGKRVLIQISGKYVSKWIEDCMELFEGLTRDRILVMKFTSGILKALELAENGELDYDVFIVSTQTLQRYFKKYESKELEPHQSPAVLNEKLGIGLKIIDEAHENTHMVFKQDLYNHVPELLALSATMSPDSEFRRRMIEVQFPGKERFIPLKSLPYIQGHVVYYNLHNSENIRSQGPQKNYSHVTYEESIMKRPVYLRSYLELIHEEFYRQYISRRVDGQRAIVFCATKKMCGLVTNFLQNKNPSLDINRYVSEDEYDSLMVSDVSVTTILSAGAAVDIDRLIAVILTTNISSSSANIQVVGRLRRLKDFPDTTPNFSYLVCNDIEKHKEYDKKKQALITEKLIGLNPRTSGITIGVPLR